MSLDSCLVQTYVNALKLETNQPCLQMQQLEAHNGQLLAGIGRLQIHYSLVVCQMSQLQQQLQVQRCGNMQLLTLIDRQRRVHPVSAEGRELACGGAVGVNCGRWVWALQ